MIKIIHAIKRNIKERNEEFMSDNGTSIAILESQIILKQYDLAEQSLTQLMNMFTKGKVGLSLAPYDRELSKEQLNLESYQVVEKFASLITVWFSDWSYTPSANMYAQMCLQKSFLNNMFAASSYHSTDHILQNLGLIGRTDYNKDQLSRLLFIVTLESSVELPWPSLFEFIPNETIQAFAGFLSSINMQMSLRAQTNIARLIQASNIAPTVETNNFKFLSPLVSTFFNCSNLTAENKYDIKRWVVRCIDNYMSKYLPKEVIKKVKKEVKKKPKQGQKTILVIHERYTKSHAMYRSWHSLLANLKEEHKVVGMAATGRADEVTKQDCHEFLDIADVENLTEIILTVLRVKPDIIIYPSIGMSIFGPFIASLRLAPIQIACTGHPSSSQLKNMDYIFTPDMGLSEEEMANIVSEKWLSAPKGVGKMASLEFTRPQVTKQPDEINIVVNGVLQKLSNNLILICKEIAQRSTKKVKFHFFLTCPKQDLEYFAGQSILRRFLPNATLHPFTEYNEYIKVLAGADFAIPTLPFGGSNSNIDLINVGVPKLFTTHKTDISGVTDYQLWESVGELYGYCDSVDMLKERAIELCNSEQELALFREKIEAIDLSSSEVFDEQEDQRFSEAIKRLF